MDQATHPPRYFACNRERAPMRRGRLGSLIRRASMRRGPTELLRLSLTGDSKRGRAAAPFCVVLRNPPRGGGRNGPLHTGCDSANRPPGPQRRTGAHSKGGQLAALSFYRRAGSEQPGPRPLRRRRLPAGDAASSLDQDSAEHDHPACDRRRRRRDIDGDRGERAAYPRERPPPNRPGDPRSSPPKRRRSTACPRVLAARERALARRRRSGCAGDRSPCKLTH